MKSFTQGVWRGTRVAAVLGAVSIFGATGCDGAPPRTAEEHVARAIEFQAENDIAAGVIELRNALQKEPQNAEARRLLGEFHLLQGDGAGAINQLERAQNLGLDDEDVRLKLAQARLLTGDVEAVVAAADAELPTAAQPAEWRAVRGEALFRLGRLDEAEEALDQAQQDRPHARAQAMLVRTAIARNDLEQALALAEEGLAAVPDDVVLNALKGDVLLAQRQPEAAEAAYRQAVALAPQGVSAQIGLARSLVFQNRADDAATVLESLGARAGNNRDVALLKGLVALQQQDLETARSHADEILRLAPNHRQALFIAGAANAGLASFEQARDQLARYLAQAPEDTYARRLLGGVQLRLGAQTQAYQTLMAAPAGIPDDDAYLTLLSAAAAQGQGGMQQSVTFMERAVTLSPDEAGLRARLGVLRMAAGDTGAAEQELLAALELDPRLQDSPEFQRAQAALALGYMREGRFDDALAVIQRELADDPDDVAWLVLSGGAHAGKGDVDAARVAFERALELEPGRSDAANNLAQIALQDGDVDEARTLLESVLESQPDHFPTLMRLAALEQNAGRTEMARERLEQAVAANPDAIAPRLGLAQGFMAERAPERALEITEPVAEAAGENAAMLAVRGQAYLQTDRPAEAARDLERLTAAAPDVAEGHFLLGGAYLRLQRLDDAKDALNRALELDPAHFGAKSALAGVMIGAGDVEAARPLVTELAASDPERVGVIVLQGQLAAAEGNPAEAAAFYEQALEQVPSVELSAALSLARWQAGDPDAAIAALKDGLAAHPDNLALMVRLSEYYIALDRRDDAKAVLRDIVRIEPGVWVAQNNLAWFLYEDGAISEARRHALRAHDVAPDHPGVADTLGMIELARGETARAVTLLRQAASGVPDNATIQYHFAQALAAAGQTEEARDVLRRALDLGTPFTKRDEAEAMLRELEAKG
ncbi:MAG: PEP-CTERM system TPR-repeat protein PrsT [Rhodospirillales bacterium]|nr:MAG: PEP-CTERM system TPR-repeat protein PrsT [Rhodospirillales bacterium]